MLNENTDNAVVEEVVAPQTETEVVETTEPTEVVEETVESSESVETEVAPVTEEKQSKEDNAKYAEVRKKAEQAGRDKFISDQYGESHGIHTEAEYKAAMAEQKKNELMEKVSNGEVDVKDAYEQMKANDPDFQKMKETTQETFVKNQLSELNNDLKELAIDVTINSVDDLVNLPNSDSVIEYVNKGNTLSEAYFLANRQDIISKKTNQIQQDTIKQIEANGNSAVGSLSNTGDTPTFFTSAQVDGMSQAEVSKNLDIIHKSMKSW